jgi:hypothetical protein
VRSTSQRESWLSSSTFSPIRWSRPMASDPSGDVRNVEVVGSSPITSTKKVQSAGVFAPVVSRRGPSLRRIRAYRAYDGVRARSQASGRGLHGALRRVRSRRWRALLGDFASDVQCACVSPRMSLPHRWQGCRPPAQPLAQRTRPDLESACAPTGQATSGLLLVEV